MRDSPLDVCRVACSAFSRLTPDDSLHGYGSKVPFTWVNVLLRTGRPVRGSGASVFLCPGSYFDLVSLAPPVTLGDYGATDDPDGPLVVFMGNAPAPENNGGQTGRDLYRIGRRKLFDTPFSTYETEIEGSCHFDDAFTDLTCTARRSRLLLP